MKRSIFFFCLLPLLLDAQSIYNLPGQPSVYFLAHSDSATIFKNWVSRTNESIVDIFIPNASTSINFWRHRPSYKYLWIAEGNNYCFSNTPLIKTSSPVSDINHVYALSYYNGPPPPAYHNDEGAQVSSSDFTLPSQEVINTHCQVDFQGGGSVSPINSYFSPFGNEISNIDEHKIFLYNNATKSAQKITVHFNGSPLVLSELNGTSNESSSEFTPEVVEEVYLIEGGERTPLSIGGSQKEAFVSSCDFDVNAGQLIFIDMKLKPENLTANLDHNIEILLPFHFEVNSTSTTIRNLPLVGPRDPNHLIVKADTCDGLKDIVLVDFHLEFLNEGERVVRENVKVEIPLESLSEDFRNVNLNDHIDGLEANVPGMTLQSTDLSDGMIIFRFETRSGFMGFGNNGQKAHIDFKLKTKKENYLNGMNEQFFASVFFDKLDPWRTGSTSLYSAECVDHSRLSAAFCEKCEKECKCKCECDCGQKSIFTKFKCWLFGC